MTIKKFAPGSNQYKKRRRTALSNARLVVLGLSAAVSMYLFQSVDHSTFKYDIAPDRLVLLNGEAQAYEKPTVTPTPTLTNSEIKDRLMIASIQTFTTDQALDIEHLVTGESGFNPTAINKSSGSCGLFQALPCKKMPCNLSRDPRDVDCQIKWGLGYIKNRYSTPNEAWAFWQAQSPHWY